MPKRSFLDAHDSDDFDSTKYSIKLNEITKKVEISEIDKIISTIDKEIAAEERQVSAGQRIVNDANEKKINLKEKRENFKQIKKDVLKSNGN